MNRLLFFTGSECVHCHKMDPLIKKLEKENKLKVTKLEVWHNSKNAALLQKLDNNKCGGVPFFYNEKTKAWLCGESSYSELKKWALGNVLLS